MAGRVSETPEAPARWQITEDHKSKRSKRAGQCLEDPGWRCLGFFLMFWKPCKYHGGLRDTKGFSTVTNASLQKQEK
eukprot:1162057-Pelagomonas_calceolata.AAC.4